MKKTIIFLAVLFFASAAFAKETGAGGKDNQPTADLLKELPGDHVLGDANAPVTIIEYASLSCPHCAAFATDTFPKIDEKYIKTGKVKYIYRHFPLNGPALKAAVLAECAGPDQYYTYINVLFDAQRKWAFTLDYVNDLKSIAMLGGMPEETFDSCMKNKALEEKVANSRLLAEKNLKINSTPTIYIDKTPIEGARDFDALAKMIDDELAKKSNK